MRYEMEMEQPRSSERGDWLMSRLRRAKRFASTVRVPGPHMKSGSGNFSTRIDIPDYQHTKLPTALSHFTSHHSPSSLIGLPTFFKHIAQIADSTAQTAAPAASYGEHRRGRRAQRESAVSPRQSGRHHQPRAGRSHRLTPAEPVERSGMSITVPAMANISLASDCDCQILRRRSSRPGRRGPGRARPVRSVRRRIPSATTGKTP